MYLLLCAVWQTNICGFSGRWPDISEIPPSGAPMMPPRHRRTSQPSRPQHDDAPEPGSAWHKKPCSGDRRATCRRWRSMRQLVRNLWLLVVSSKRRYTHATLGFNESYSRSSGLFVTASSNSPVRSNLTTNIGGQIVRIDKSMPKKNMCTIIRQTFIILKNCSIPHGPASRLPIDSNVSIALTENKIQIVRRLTASIICASLRCQGANGTGQTLRMRSPSRSLRRVARLSLHVATCAPMMPSRHRRAAQPSRPQHDDPPEPGSSWHKKACSGDRQATCLSVAFIVYMYRQVKAPSSILVHQSTKASRICHVAAGIPIFTPMVCSLK